MAESTPLKDPIDVAVEDSFPASDPPEWTGMHAGAPIETPRWPAEDLKTLRTAWSVDEAVARIESAIAAAGMKVFARIDQAAEARSVGLALRPAVVLLFGSPKAGTPLMVARPTVAIDLPLKALVWQDDDGATWLTYNTPDLLVRRHGLDASLARRLAPAAELLQKAVGPTS